MSAPVNARTCVRVHPLLLCSYIYIYIYIYCSHALGPWRKLLNSESSENLDANDAAGFIRVLSWRGAGPAAAAHDKD
jgi:hypothetical protein